MLPAIGVSRARLSKSAPHNQQQTHQTKRILPVLNKPKKHHLQSAPPTGRLKKAPSGINLNGQPAMMSPKQRRVVISVHKTSTYNYTILPGNNTRGKVIFIKVCQVNDGEYYIIVLISPLSSVLLLCCCSGHELIATTTVVEM